MECKTTASNNIIDLDLAEYDQVDEFKLIMDNQNQFYCDNTKLLVTLSSCSDQAPVDDTNCENDFVFLPAPMQQQQQQQQTQKHQQQSSTVLAKSQNATTTTTTPTATATQVGDQKQKTQIGIEITETGSSYVTDNNNSNKTIQYPLITLNNNGINNPFDNYQQHNQATGGLKLQYSNAQLMKKPAESFYGSSTKPYGIIEQPETSHLVSSANKLADLMQQIVTKSDLIYIAIPCNYCPYNEPVACPPSDISSWINHMSMQHNCKICPICNRLVGLGPERDLNVMRKHVVEHLDDDWLDKRASRVSFTFGLQQKWFSGSRCAIKDSRHR